MSLVDSAPGKVGAGTPALDNISRIIKEVRKDYGYRIRGHEIHQVAGVMRRTSLAERAKMVSSFCATNELENISYHAPILYPGDNIWDEKRRGRVIESIKVTVEEAEAVCKEAGLDKPVIVFHLKLCPPGRASSYVGSETGAAGKSRARVRRPLQGAGQAGLAHRDEGVCGVCGRDSSAVYSRRRAGSILEKHESD